jgi:hypothetical protein
LIALAAFPFLLVVGIRAVTIAAQIMWPVFVTILPWLLGGLLLMAIGGAAYYRYRRWW